MKVSEELKQLRNKTDAELLREIYDAEKKLIEMRIQAKKQELKDVSQIAKLRKKLARIKTILLQRKYLASLKEKNE